MTHENLYIIKGFWTKYFLLVVLWLFIRIFPVSAQSLVNQNLAKDLIEKTYLVTDREMYCVGEKILFSAFNLSSPELRKVEWSNVLYVELVSPDGQVLAKSKFSYNSEGANGMLRIPSGALTGNYFLKAYTRWMRDFPPDSYFYKPVTVINPFLPELLKPTTNAVVEKADFTTSDEHPAGILIRTNKDQFTRRELVSVRVEIDPKEISSDKYTVSVIPAGTEGMSDVKFRKEGKVIFSPDFIPETRGLSVSGKVVSENDSVPVPYTLVGLTVFREKPETKNVRTDEKGRFFFDLSKLKGESEIFISARSGDGKNPLVLIDNDFSTKQASVPYLSFNLSPGLRTIYQRLAFVSQIHAMYLQQKIEQAAHPVSRDSSFYGKPDFTLKLSDFVVMPSLTDYFYELVHSVKVRHDGKDSSMKVLGTYSELSVYDPLVLLDMVPIFDIGKLLLLQPEKIDRIEVVNSPYVRGDIVFGGIISLFSSKGDLAGIDLPSTGRFVNYSMLGESKAETVQPLAGQYIPDLKNCLYWNPALKPDHNNVAEFLFSTGDNYGDFLIVVKGIENGKERNAIQKVLIK